MQQTSPPDFAAIVLRAALCGDALGRPFQGLKPAHIEQLAGGRVEGFLVNPILLPEKPEKNFLPGLHGAAGQRLLVALAAATEDTLDRPPAARAGSRWGELVAADPDGFGEWRQPTAALRRALSRWKETYPWEEADFIAADEASEDSSPAIVGLAMAALMPNADAVELAEKLARQTHARPCAVAAATCMALALPILAGTRKKLDAQDAVRRLTQQLRDVEEAYIAANKRTWRALGWDEPLPRLWKALEPVPSLLREANDLLTLKTLLAGSEIRDVDSNRPTHAQHPLSVVGIPWVIYRAFGDLSPVLAVEDAINRGGESGLSAALIAGLMAARHGAETLPEEWYKGTRAMPLLSAWIAERSEESLNALLTAEARWNGQESALRKPLEEEAERQRKLAIERGDIPKPKKSQLAAQEDATFAPPPHLWLKPGDEEDPEKKRILKEARGKRRIDWKEDRRKDDR